MLLAIENHKKQSLNSQTDSEEIPQTTVDVVGAKGQDYIGAGVRGIYTLLIHGPIGDFGLCAFCDGECNIEGNVGNFVGHSIHSGILMVTGNALHSVGALGTGGLITIYGTAGDRAAVGLQGSDVVFRGSVGDFACLGMQSGTVIIGGNAGHHLGYGMRGGTIYIRGDAESVSPDIEEQRLREPDRLKIGLLLLKAGIKSAGKDFRVYRPVNVES